MFDALNFDFLNMRNGVAIQKKFSKEEEIVSYQKMWVNLLKPVRFFPPNLEKIQEILFSDFLHDSPK